MTQKKDWFSQYDTIPYGLLVGALMAIIGFFLNYFLNPYLFSRFWHLLTVVKRFDLGLVGDMMTMALIMPMAVFYFTFFRNNYVQFSRGLLFIILPVVIFIVVLQTQ